MKARIGRISGFAAGGGVYVEPTGRLDGFRLGPLEVLEGPWSPQYGPAGNPIHTHPAVRPLARGDRVLLAELPLDNYVVVGRLPA